MFTIANALQDKVGPFCRAASDCALILDASRGRDPDDVASLDVALDNPFWVNLTGLTLGVLPSVQDRASEVIFLLTETPHDAGPDLHSCHAMIFSSISADAFSVHSLRRLLPARA